MPGNRYFIGVDLGGTNIRAAAVSPEGDIHIRRRAATGPDDGYKAVVGRIVSAIESIVEEAGAKPVSVGLASPGAINFDRGIIVRSPNFPGWRNIPLSGDVEKAVGIPVTLENDANSAAIGEGWLGVAKGWSDYLMFTLGTGVGGGIMMDGKIWHGPTGMGGEVGHLMVEPGGRTCGCGSRGCLETYSSATGVKQSARERFPAPGAQWLKEASHGLEDNIGAKMVAEGAAMGDRLCVEVLNDAGMYLGRAIAQATLLLDITRYAFAGGMSPALPLMENAIRKEAFASAYTLKGKELYLRMAILGDDAGLLGAVRVAMRADGNNP